MESSTQTIHPQDTPSNNYTLQVDFSWKKFKALITENGDPQAKPLYIVDYKTFKPNLVFKTGADNDNFATGTLHCISIHSDCEIRGQPIKIKALKRWRTQYMHLSQAFSETGSPIPMHWGSSTGFKTWDFICLDNEQNPVAKFSANCWSMTNIGNIEFMKSAAELTDAQRDEIVVTGITLFYCMVLRASNILNFFGAIFARTGPVEAPDETPVETSRAIDCSTEQNRHEVTTQ